MVPTGPAGVALIDPLAVDIAPLARLLDGPGQMVAHAADQDLEVLERACGTVPSAVVRHPGGGRVPRPRVGVAGRAGLDLPRDRGCPRATGSPTGATGPLTPGQLCYAAADVAHLSTWPTPSRRRCAGPAGWPGRRRSARPPGPGPTDPATRSGPGGSSATAASSGVRPEAWPRRWPPGASTAPRGRPTGALRAARSGPAGHRPWPARHPGGARADPRPGPPAPRDRPARSSPPSSGRGLPRPPAGAARRRRRPRPAAAVALAAVGRPAGPRPAHRRRPPGHPRRPGRLPARHGQSRLGRGWRAAWSANRSAS